MKTNTLYFNLDVLTLPVNIHNESTRMYLQSVLGFKKHKHITKLSCNDWYLSMCVSNQSKRGAKILTDCVIDMCSLIQ